MSFLLVILALVAAPALGLLLLGLDRKLTARLQGRIGPPIRQPLWDILKLLQKQPIIVNRPQILYVWLHLVLTVLVVVMLALGQDMLLILFVHAFAAIALILGGMCVRSPYSRLGSMRKIMQLLAYEPILLIMVFGISNRTGSFMASSVWSHPHPLLLDLPLIFLAFVAAIAIKLDKSPFDVATSHHAHQELVKGVTTEYSGPYLALIEIAHAFEAAMLFTVVALFWKTNLLIGTLLEALVFAFILLLDNAWARLTTGWMVRFMWAVPLILASSNLAWFFFGKA